MMNWVLGGVGIFLFGVSLGWAIAALRWSSRVAREREARISAESILAAQRTAAERETILLDETKTRTTEAVRLAAGEAMRANVDVLAKLAGDSFRNLLGESREEILRRQEAVEHLVTPLREQLTRFSDGVLEMRAAQVREFGGLSQLIDSVTRSQQELQKETARLATALASPKTRGRWGELTLKRVLDISGMSEYCDYQEQVSVHGEEGLSRPDLLVRLPGDKVIAVDAKVPFEAYTEAVSAEDENSRTMALRRHASLLKDHIKRLAARTYWKDLERSPGFVVLFLPSEGFLSAALAAESKIVEEAMERNVLLATPVTLVAVLKAVAQGWTEERLARGAEMVREEGKLLYKRLEILASHLSGLGRALRQAVDAFNQTVGSFETRVLPSARRFHDLGVVDSAGIDAPGRVDVKPPRQVAGDEENGDF